MNFRTTILLLVVLVAAAAVYFITSRDPGNDPTNQAQTDGGDASAEGGKKLFELTASNVNKVSVTPAAGQRLVLERSGPSEWRMLEPVKAPAEAFKVDDLLREVLDLRSTGRESPADKGVDAPKYVIELTDKDNRTTKLNVGAHSPVGDILYVRPEGQEQVDIVSGSIVAQLEKPASEYRKLRLVNVSNEEVTGVTITHGGQTLKLARDANKDWQILEPKAMPGDSGQVSSLLSSITGVSAVKFVSEDLKDPARYGFTDPQMTVALTTEPPASPTTAPAATQPTAGETVTLKFGGPQDVFKKNLYATASESGPVAMVLATSLDALKKTPLDLRQRDVLDIDDRAVSRVSITTEKAATTQPTTQPASKSVVVLERRSEQPTSAPATTAPATGPATGPASTQLAAATQPAAPKTKWLVASDPKGDADDDAVQELLRAFRPLTADRFLETFPATQAAPTAAYVVRISTRAWADEPAREHELKITDQGAGANAKLIGQLGDLTFEMNRTVLDALTRSFAAPKVEPAGPAFGPAGPAPALPGVPPVPPPAQ